MTLTRLAPVRATRAGMKVGRWLGAIVSLAALGGCRRPEGLEDVLAREVERAAERSPRRLTPGPLDDERWQPDAALPRSHLWPRAELVALEAYVSRCGEPPALDHGDLRKALAWARFRCGHAPLPAGFFAAPPFLHPDGRSYAWHAHDCPEPACREAARSADLHHVLERADVDPERWPVLDRAALVRVRAAEPFASVGSTLLVRRAGTYASVRLTDLVRASPRLGLGTGARCDARALGRCWVDLDPLRAGARARAAAWLTALAFGVALVAVVAWRVRVGRRLASERVFVLRWLAHELRTPVTALKLEVEGLRDDFDELPTRAQDRFLTLARDVTRLQRVVEASAVYLRSEAARGERPRRVESLRAFVEAVADEVHDEDPVTRSLDAPVGDEPPADLFAIDAPDAPVALPVSTTALALRNLLRNAVRHGQAPRRVQAVVDAAGVSFTVRDAGYLADETIRSLGTAFVSADGEGLGIGLYLAHHAARSVGGSLRASRDPTSFSLRIPRADS